MDPEEQLTLLGLPPEVLRHVVSFVGTPWDLCSLGMVCHVLAEISGSDSMWRPLCNPYWPVDETEGSGWKRAYLKWFHAALNQYFEAKQDLVQRSSQNNKQKERKSGSVDQCDHLLRIAFVGDAKCGKSSLVARYAHDTFSEAYVPTATVEYPKEQIDVERQNKRFKMFICEWLSLRYQQSGICSFFRGMNVCFLVYDINNKSSLNELSRWREDLDRYLVPSRTPVAIVCSKCDRHDDETQAHEDEYKAAGRQLAQKWGYDFFTCSAKTGFGVQEIFLSAIDMWLLRWQNVADIPKPTFVPDTAAMDALLKAYKADEQLQIQRGAFNTKKKQGRCLLQ